MATDLRGRPGGLVARLLLPVELGAAQSVMRMLDSLPYSRCAVTCCVVAYHKHIDAVQAHLSKRACHLAACMHVQMKAPQEAQA